MFEGLVDQPLTHLIRIKGDAIEELKQKMDETTHTGEAENEKFRRANNLPHAYWYDHFVYEGRVLYLLDSDKRLIHRNAMYKIKPKVQSIVKWIL
jgi:hypothetical protein